MEANAFINLIKPNAIFKEKDSFIDLILTNRKYSCKHSVETGISDDDHLISTNVQNNLN